MDEIFRQSSNFHENVLIVRNCMLKDLEVNCHDSSNLLLNALAKIKYIHLLSI
jgi:hypothetical protein